MAANKADLYEYEEVDEEEARKYADEKDILFEITSAKNGNGIEPLFRKIAIKLVNLEKNNESNEQNNFKRNNAILNKNKQKSRKKKKPRC